MSESENETTQKTDATTVETPATESTSQQTPPSNTAFENNAQADNNTKGDNSVNNASQTKVENNSTGDASLKNANSDDKVTEVLFDANKMNLLSDIAIPISIEIGRTRIKIRDLLTLSKGSILELDKLAGDPVDVYANGKLIALGNIITANGKYCVKLMSVNSNNTEVKGELK